MDKPQANKDATDLTSGEVPGVAEALNLFRFAPQIKSAAPPNRAEIIGVATMSDDGAITLSLEAEQSGSAIHGEAHLTYPKSDKQYSDIVNHVGGLRPGEVKLVPAFNDPTTIQSDVIPNPNGTVSGLRPTPPPLDAAVVKEVQDTVDAMDAPVKKLIHDSGIRVVVSPSVTDALPQLANQRPRGWPQGSTWDSCDGAFDPGSKTAVVAADHLQNGTWLANSSPQGVARHETGHAVNYEEHYSESPDFKKAFADDVSNMPADAKKRLAYFVAQSDDRANRDETFAENFASKEGGTSYPGYQQDISQYFVAIAKTISTELSTLPAPPNSAPPPPAQTNKSTVVP